MFNGQLTTGSRRRVETRQEISGQRQQKSSSNPMTSEPARSERHRVLNPHSTNRPPKVRAPSEHQRA
jgi:hypothetical protein